MSLKEYILVQEVCSHYTIEVSFVSRLHDMGLLEVHHRDQSLYLHHDEIGTLEKIMRLYQDLQVNLEGVDIIFNLLKRIDQLEKELSTTKQKLYIQEIHYR